MNKKSAREAVEEMTLLLLYLTRFSEKDGGFTTENLSWKGYPFTVLNSFSDKGFISQGKHPSRSKSVWITPDGVAQAKKLLEQYGIEERKE